MNGAGKTTLFRMLTGDLAVTHGDAMLLGKRLGIFDRSIFQLYLAVCVTHQALGHSLSTQSVHCNSCMMIKLTHAIQYVFRCVYWLTHVVWT